jgi:hypothetical protein
MQLALETADLFVSEWPGGFFLGVSGSGLVLGPNDLEFGGRIHDDGPAGRCRGDLEVGRSITEELSPNAVASDHR